MDLTKRLAKLEREHGKHKAAVFVFPPAITPEHNFRSDDEFYKDQAVQKFGRDDFDVAVFPGKKERTEPIFDFIGDLQAFIDDVAKNSARIGFPQQTEGEQGQA